MSTGDWSETDEPEIGARCLTLCQRVEFDGTNPVAPYSLRGVLSVLPVRSGFPAMWQESIWLYVEFFGAAGEYEVWFDLVRLVYDEEAGELVDEIEETVYGPYAATFPLDAFVHSRAYYLKKVPLNAPGLHELRLRVAGVSEVLFSQRFLVRG